MDLFPDTSYNEKHKTIKTTTIKHIKTISTVKPSHTHIYNSNDDYGSDMTHIETSNTVNPSTHKHLQNDD